jgi:hypothetical protein
MYAKKQHRPMLHVSFSNWIYLNSCFNTLRSARTFPSTTQSFSSDRNHVSSSTICCIGTLYRPSLGLWNNNYDQWRK